MTAGSMATRGRQDMDLRVDDPRPHLSAVEQAEADKATVARMLLRRGCGDLLEALSLVAPVPVVEKCRNGHDRTSENTTWQGPHKRCRDCSRVSNAKCRAKQVTA